MADDELTDDDKRWLGKIDRELDQREAHPELAEVYDAIHLAKDTKRRQREMVSEALEEGLRELRIPDHMHHAIRTYVVDRHRVGDFLTAVLENNLKESVVRADQHNLAALVDWAKLLYNYCPSACQGSPAKVKAWLKGEKNEVQTAD